jgi:hypothetical protein
MNGLLLDANSRPRSRIELSPSSARKGTHGRSCSMATLPYPGNGDKSNGARVRTTPRVVHRMRLMTYALAKPPTRRRFASHDAGGLQRMVKGPPPEEAATTIAPVPVIRDSHTRERRAMPCRRAQAADHHGRYQDRRRSTRNPPKAPANCTSVPASCQTSLRAPKRTAATTRLAKDKPYVDESPTELLALTFNPPPPHDRLHV